MTRAGVLFAIVIILGLAGPAVGSPDADTLSIKPELSLRSYRLDIGLDYANEVLRGRAWLRLENASPRATSSATLLLYRLMRVTAVTDGNGNPLSYTQEVVGFTDFPPLQVNRIIVSLGAALASSARTEIEVAYEGYLLGYAETGMSYIKDRIDPVFTILRNDAFAFPLPGDPSLDSLRGEGRWRFDFTVSVTVPDSLVVANGGHLDRREDHDGLRTYTFSSRRPSWRLDLAIARYATLTRGPVLVYYLPGDSAGASRTALAVDRALSRFREWFGPLREEAALTVIEIPDGCGSQADVVTIIQTAAAFRDPASRFEIYHEVSHLWNVPSTDTSSPRIEEGLASFLQFLAAEEIDGGSDAEARSDTVLAQVRRELATTRGWPGGAMIDCGRTGRTDLSYRVGALMFAELYNIVGRPVFNEIIGEYYRRFGSGGGIGDFVDLACALSPLDLHPFFADWIYTTDWTARARLYAHCRDLAQSYLRALPSPSLRPRRP